MPRRPPLPNYKNMFYLSTLKYKPTPTANEEYKWCDVATFPICLNGIFHLNNGKIIHLYCEKGWRFDGVFFFLRKFIYVRIKSYDGNTFPCENSVIRISTKKDFYCKP